jgi:hypothetical protein
VEPEAQFNSLSADKMSTGMKWGFAILPGIVILEGVLDVGAAVITPVAA